MALAEKNVHMRIHGEFKDVIRRGSRISESLGAFAGIRSDIGKLFAPGDSESDLADVELRDVIATREERWVVVGDGGAVQEDDAVLHREAWDLVGFSTTVGSRPCLGTRSPWSSSRRRAW